MTDRKNAAMRHKTRSTIQKNPEYITPVFCSQYFPVDSAYHTFKENIAKGYGLEEIQDLLEQYELDAAEISAGLQRLLFGVSEFVKSQQKQKFSTVETQQYLMNHGYTIEVIRLAYLRLNQTLH
jgi:SOS response regulatory protein OraA/RecX